MQLGILCPVVAVSAAEEVLMEDRLIRMSPDGFAAFIAAVPAPAVAVPELAGLAQRPAQWEPGYASR